METKNLYYKTQFSKFRAISSTITMKEADNDQSKLVEISNFRKQVKLKNPDKNDKKKMFLKTYISF